MKKWIAIFLLILSFTILVTACGGDNNETNTDSVEEKDVEVSTENTLEDEPEEKESSNEDDSNSTLPNEVPSDFPFPDGIDLKVETMEISGAINYVVAFSISDDPDSYYQEFMDYSTNNGYTITLEDKENYSFKSTKDSLEAIGVEFSDMGSVKIGTVTFTIPTE